MMRVVLLWLFSLLFVPAAASASVGGQGQHYRAALIARQATAKPGGTLTYALVLRPDAGWHIYWSNPGQTGYAPGLRWALPPGFGAGRVRHPVPQKLVLGGYASNVHAGETILLQDMKVPKAFATERDLTLRLDLDLLVCSETNCVPDPISLSDTRRFGDGSDNPDATALFARAAARLPRPAAAPATMAPDKSGIRFFFPGLALHRGDKATLFSEVPEVLAEDGVPQVETHDEGLSLRVKAGTAKLGQSLAVVLRVDRADRRVDSYRFTASPMPLVQARFDWAGFLMAFGAAVLGGLLLNLMPCVFPMISLKAMSLVRTGADEREARVEAMGYAIGAIGTIAAMGALLLMLRGTGSALGWAFQLQDPRVVAGLLLLVVAIATNMAGLYELPALSVSTGPVSSGYWGSISTGGLAAFIATPCTGPFMAGALGTAMVLPIPAAMAIFVGLGVGLALPFLGLGFVKPLRRWVPRPGPWMVTFRHLLSLPMFATALGLAWILGRQTGLDAVMGVLAAALALGLALWWYGLRQRSGKRGRIAMLPALGAVVAALILAATPHPGSAASLGTVEKDVLATQSFSEGRLAALQSQKRPVLLYFTADWCLTCKVNEASSLANTDVAASFAAHHVAVLRGDWTRQDPAITRFLKSHGRAGVPLYLWYDTNGGVQELPQVLTPSLLTGLADMGA